MIIIIVKIVKGVNKTQEIFILFRLQQKNMRDNMMNSVE
jgi:hypothetical protein